jgi:hypothetical protein
MQQSHLFTVIDLADAPTADLARRLEKAIPPLNGRAERAAVLYLGGAVSQTGETTYAVQGSNLDRTYTVELTQPDKTHAAQCDCPDFQKGTNGIAKAAPIYSAPCSPEPTTPRCKHILAVWIHTTLQRSI